MTEALVSDENVWVTDGPRSFTFCAREFVAPDCLLMPVRVLGPAKVGDICVIKGHAVSVYQKYYVIQKLIDACENRGVAEGHVLVQA